VRGRVRLSGPPAGLGSHPPTARAWLALAGLSALGALALHHTTGPAGAALAQALDWQPARLGSEPWRAITAAWVHLSLLHLGANLLGTALVAALGVVAGCDQRAALAWALAWPLTQLGLVVQPQLLHYGGLSGVLHAAVVVAALHLVLREAGRRRAIGAALLAGVAAKLLLEAPWAGPLRQVAGWDIAIAPLAHASGACAGALCGLWLLRPPRRRPGAPLPPPPARVAGLPSPPAGLRRRGP